MELQLTWAAIIAGIALFTSIISPLLTVIIKNKHEREMYKVRFFYQHRAEVIERYVSSVGAAIHGQRAEDLCDYGKYAGEIFMYVPERLWPTIDQINLAIRGNNREYADGYFRTLCAELSKEHPRPIKQGRYGNKKQGIK